MTPRRSFLLVLLIDIVVQCMNLMHSSLGVVPIYCTCVSVPRVVHTFYVRAIDQEYSCSSKNSKSGCMHLKLEALQHQSIPYIVELIQRIRNFNCCIGQRFHE